MIECSNGLGHSLKAHSIVLACHPRGGRLSETEQKGVGGGDGGWGERPGRGIGMTAAKVTGGVREG